MAKDPRKNVNQYKTSGGGLNEFEFHQHQQEFSEQHKIGLSHIIPGTPPESRIEEVTRKAHELVMKRAKSAPEKGTVSGDSGKRSAARETKPASKSPRKAASKK